MAVRALMRVRFSRRNKPTDILLFKELCLRPHLLHCLRMDANLGYRQLPHVGEAGMDYLSQLREAQGDCHLRLDRGPERPALICIQSRREIYGHHWKPGG